MELIGIDYNIAGNLWNLKLKKFADYYLSRAVIEDHQFKIFIDCVHFSESNFYIGTFYRLTDDKLTLDINVCYPTTTTIMEYLKIYDKNLYSQLIDEIEVMISDILTLILF